MVQLRLLWTRKSIVECIKSGKCHQMNAFRFIREDSASWSSSRHDFHGLASWNVWTEAGFTVVGARGNQNVEAPNRNNKFRLRQFFFLFSFLIIRTKFQVMFRDFREADISIKHVDSISVLWGPRGDRPGTDVYICILSYQFSVFFFVKIRYHKS
jgi:hypothetical protein